MQKTKDNITHYLGKGVPAAVNADDFNHAELLTMARVARACETMLTISVSAETTRNNLDLVCDEAKGYVSLDFRF